ncbi:hypothetical protein [Dyadobacter sp. 22481]|uniref:hypothetical protein n=1 Tax=Dyadobacter sp. 22481 TaxID=3453926 RepID=UPI003F8420AD
MRVVFVLVFALFGRVSHSQDIHIGGRNLKNIEHRLIFSQKDENQIKDINLKNAGIKKIGLVYISDNQYSYRKTAPIPLNNQYSTIDPQPSFRSRIDSVIIRTLKANNAIDIFYLPDSDSLSIEKCFQVKFSGANFRDRQCAEENFKILFKNNFHAVVVLYEQEIPDYFTQTNTRLLSAKGYFSSLKKTLVYQSLMCRIIAFNTGSKTRSTTFQQLSAKLIEENDNLDYREFVKKFGNTKEDILLNQIANNIDEIVKVLNK